MYSPFSRLNSIFLCAGAYSSLLYCSHVGYFMFECIVSDPGQWIIFLLTDIPNSMGDCSDGPVYE